MSKDLSCKKRWFQHKESRISDLRILWRNYEKGIESDEDLGSIYDYGLCFDYVPKGTFNDQKRGYWRYQLSWGGPSEEFRFYADGPKDINPDNIEFVFLDWYDGYSRSLVGKDLELMKNYWEWFMDCGVVESSYNE